MTTAPPDIAELHSREDGLILGKNRPSNNPNQNRWESTTG
jgi:hypothetical protein